MRKFLITLLCFCQWLFGQSPGSDTLSYHPLGEWRDVTSLYGWRADPFYPRDNQFHQGIDLQAKEGDPVYAWRPGTVVKAGYQSGYGRSIVLQHAGNYKSRYHHLSQILVKQGQHVQAGELIGKAGATGDATGVHLHFSILKNGKQVDPLPYLQKAQRRPPNLDLSTRTSVGSSKKIEPKREEKPQRKPQFIPKKTSRSRRGPEAALFSVIPGLGHYYLKQKLWFVSPISMGICYAFVLKYRGRKEEALQNYELSRDAESQNRYWRSYQDNRSLEKSFQTAIWVIWGTDIVTAFIQGMQKKGKKSRAEMIIPRSGLAVDWKADAHSVKASLTLRW